MLPKVRQQVNRLVPEKEPSRPYEDLPHAPMTAIFAAAIFLSSALLFWLEPLFGKMVLPLVGGAPPAWNACILFYQTALVAGYAWAHAADRLGSRRHMLVHLALSIASLAVLPFAIPRAMLPPSETHPLAWILAVLALGVGLPFVLVAANGPLLQRSFSRSGSRHASDPYFLYAASNLGSGTALLLYPVLFEPSMTLQQQGQGWRIGFIALLALLVACAVVLWRTESARPASPPTRAPGDPPTESISWRRRLLWLALAAIPSSLMLGVTTYISSEVAPVPLIWIIPLAIYLGTLVAAFAATGRLSRVIDAIFAGRFTVRALAPSAGVLVVIGGCFFWVSSTFGSRSAVVVIHLMLFAMAALICHVRLAVLRPSASRLTEYYLITAIGGAVGGLFNTMVGPLIFTSVLEYPLGLTAVLMVLPARGRSGDEPSRLIAGDLVWPVVVGVGAMLVPVVLRWSAVELPFSPRLLLAAPALACLAFSGRPFRFGAGLAAVVLASASYPSEIGAIEHEDRNFYGVHRVLRDDRAGFRWLTNGVTVHGGQRLADSAAPFPLTYYTPSGPAGDAFRTLIAGRPSAAIGVMGLGAGALMYFGRAGQHWTYFEIDPAVTALARDPKYFSFLSRARADYRVIGGDARLALARDTARFDLLVLDVFASDAIPTHLLTREALALYRSRLRPRGVILMHISHRFFDLGPVVGELAKDAGLAALHRSDEEADDMETTGKFGSHWAVLAASGSDVAALASQPGWMPLAADDHARVWTDDYSSVLPLLRGPAR